MSFTDPDDVYATCTAAADLIERDGLFRGSFFGRYGFSSVDYEPGMQMCTLGAIRVAVGHYNGLPYDGTGWSGCAATEAVRTELCERLGRRAAATVVGPWNDDTARDAAEVVDLLRYVAAKHQPDEYRSGSPG